MSQYSLVNRIGLGTLIVVLLFTLLPDHILRAQSFSSSHVQTGFSIYMCIIVFSTVMMKGQNNARFVYIFMSISVFEIWLYLFLNHLLMDASLYIRMWIGTVISFLSYCLIHRANVILLCSFQLMTKVPGLRQFGLESLINHSPTRFNLQLVSVMKYYFLFELLIATYCLLYSLFLGIPVDGSMYQTILTNNHLDYLPLYYLGNDLLLILTIYVFGKTIVEEWQDQPDMLIKET